MNIKINSLWTYCGPNIPGPENSMAPNGQLHKVIFSKPGEVITTGLPFGHGGSFIGTSAEFLAHAARLQDPEGADYIRKAIVQLQSALTALEGEQ